MIKKKVLNALIASSSVIIAGQAIADLNIYADPNVMTRSTQESELYSFKQIGTSLEKANRVSSGELPLSMAIDYLIPKGWDVRVNNELNSEPVQWKGNVAWPYALESISQNNQMDIVVNWERRYVDIESNARHIEAERIELAQFEREFSQPNRDNLLERETVNQNDSNNNASSANLLEREISENNESQETSQNTTNKSLLERETLTTGDNNTSLLDNPDILEENNEQENDNSTRGLEDLSPSEEFQLRREYQDAYVLPYNDSFDSFVRNQNVDIHEYMELTFILKAGMTVQENIREWGREMPNDWTVVWNANKDFLIEKEIRLQNTFIDVFPVIESFYENTSYPIELEVYLRNNTIRVINKNYRINHSGVR